MKAAMNIVTSCGALAAVLSLAGVGCGRKEPSPLEPRAAAPASVAAVPAATLAPRSFPFPGAQGPAFLDYIAYERGARRVWVPVGSTGSVDVLDIAAGTFTRVDGFKTVEREARGAKRTMGPSAVSLGEGVAYIGNRGTSEVCAIDTKTLTLGKCLRLPAAIDGVAYVASSKEVWVTAPQETSLFVLDASTPGQLAMKATIKLAGEPEGYGVDESRGLFFTNLEDKGGTVVIDIKTRAPRATWNAGCGAEGPRGLAVDEARNRVMVACTDHVQVLDGAHDGARLGALDMGAGVDNIDWLPAKKLLYVAAGKAARLTIARIDDVGRLEVVATGPTAPGARNPVADDNGNGWVADSQGARLLGFDAHSVLP
jgi:DNA-binding beta-propeller fold protein YncE/predicted small lipoprotein YifL